ncbi:MAG: RNA polymerase sigma factor RpoD [Erysipelotrichaceae bacterium]|jgi:RNA polymerase primary sigma factor|nr:RNA polymerase sigma factor RpoD [Erysipelotrichaceae bacterium]
MPKTKTKTSDNSFDTETALPFDKTIEELIKLAEKNDNKLSQEEIVEFTKNLDEDVYDDVIEKLTERGINLEGDEEVIDDDDVIIDDLSGLDEVEDDQIDLGSKKDDVPSNAASFNSYSEEDPIDPVKKYLKELGKYPLLKQVEEEELSIAIINAKEATKKLEDPSLNLTNDEKYQLQRTILAGKKARDRLISSNLRLVVALSKKYISRGLPLLDLINEGNLGLMKAVEKFDYTRKFKFSTYATWWIKQAISRAIADQARTIRIPVHMVETINKINRAKSKLIQDLGRDPTPEEISSEMHGVFSPEKIREIQRLAVEPVSIETPVGEDEESTIIDMIGDPNGSSPINDVNKADLRDKLLQMLSDLTDREEAVVIARYGLLDNRPKTLEEVGKMFNVTRERIRQIEAKAIRKLRHRSRMKLIEEFK